MKIISLIALLLMIISISCQKHRVFYYVKDLTDHNWNDIPISSVNDEHLIPDDCIAWALYSNTINETGFAQLEVHTNQDIGDSLQAYHAGFIEGYLTAELMGMHWRNQIDLYCVNQEKYCTKLFKFLDINLKTTQQRVKSMRKTDSYWHQIGLVLEQLTGLQDGYNFKLWSHRPKKPRMEVDSKGMISLNLLPELGELELMLNKSTKNPKDGSCSVIIKPLKDGSDLFVAHNTWVWYSMMLRVIKKYELNYHRFANSSDLLIPGRVTAFSSYPGAISSIDDFYMMSSGLTITESSITNINFDLWKHIKPDQIVLEFIRNLVANRLSASGKEWTQIFERYNSGTYNNQFMIVDYNKFTAGTTPQDLSDNLLWVLEQMPGHIKSADMTDVVRKQGYWASYNIPYFPDIYNISGYNKLLELHGEYYSHNNTARAKIFRRDQANVKDLASIYRLMRYNDFQNDPLSKCECTPPYTAEYAISGRNDLNDPNGVYTFDAIKFRDWGAIDVKVTNNEMMKRHEMLVVSSPAYELQQPFQWSITSLPKHIRHEGHPDKWAFLPYFVKWFPNHNEVAGVTITELPNR